jgi:beta-phosphoglucomutase
MEQDHPMLKAVIFDFDGVIVDTEPLHYRAFQQVLEPLGLGYSWEDYVDRYMGFDDRDAFMEAFTSAGRALDGQMLEWLIGDKAAAFQQIISVGVTAYPGVVELVGEIAAQLPLALCSGALPSDIEPIISQLGLASAFSVIVTAADVSASKPDPASYALAVARLAERHPTLQIEPRHCLAIEDTPAGIASASGAGVAVLALTNSYPAAHLASAIRIVPSLADVRLADLRQLL